MTSTDKMEMQIAEDQDGSAVVTLPDSMASPQANTDSPMHSEGSSTDDIDSPPQQNDGLDHDPNREAIRAARREERKLKKQLHREKARESSHLVNALRQQNQSLSERLAHIEQRTSGAELARVDKAIEDAGVQVEYAKMKMQAAVESKNGQGVTSAQEMWFEAQRKLESLTSLKHQATKQMSQPKQNIAQPDPIVKKMAAEWMEDNPWYDPSGKNEESQIAQVIDKRLTSEGYDPTSEDYWEELTDRLQKYIPTVQKQGYNDSGTRTQRPKSVMTSSGRETTATTKSNEFRLSPQRVSAMKEAGLWDNSELRQKAIRKYAEWDRSNKTRSA
jgi:hypothetical protein